MRIANNPLLSWQKFPWLLCDVLPSSWGALCLHSSLSDLTSQLIRRVSEQPNHPKIFLERSVNTGGSFRTWEESEYLSQTKIIWHLPVSELWVQLVRLSVFLCSLKDVSCLSRALATLCWKWTPSPGLSLKRHHWYCSIYLPQSLIAPCLKKIDLQGFLWSMAALYVFTSLPGFSKLYSCSGQFGAYYSYQCSQRCDHSQHQTSVLQLCLFSSIFRH